MAILNNPMGALAAVNHSAVVSASSTGVAPTMLADWRCMARNPITDENKRQCADWCKTTHPEKPCVVSCFYGSDGRSGCVLKANCMACEEAPEIPGSVQGAVSQ